MDYSNCINEKIGKITRLTYNNITKKIPEWSDAIGISENAKRHRLTIFSINTQK